MHPLPIRPFENDVKMYGTQTRTGVISGDSTFENDVKKYGTQTYDWYPKCKLSLRMM